MSTFLPSGSPNDFTGDNIRREWHKNDYYYSVIDLISELIDRDHKGAKSYWSTLKQRLKQEGNETVTNCDRLKLLAPDGKKRLTDVVNTEQALRLIQSIPSPKAEPMKLWLAQVGTERLEETTDPETAELKRHFGRHIDLSEDETDSGDLVEVDSDAAKTQYRERRIQQYRDMGRSDEWITTREMSIITRKQFMEVLRAMLGNKAAFGQITNDVYRGVFHMDTKGLRTHLELKPKDNPRDHFSRLGLIFTMEAEAACDAMLYPYRDDDYLRISDVRKTVKMLAGMVGIHADHMGQVLNIDIVSGKPLLASNSTTQS
jgi:hypothetical protein